MRVILTMGSLLTIETPEYFLPAGLLRHCSCSKLLMSTYSLVTNILMKMDCWCVSGRVKRTVSRSLAPCPISDCCPWGSDGMTWLCAWYHVYSA